MPQQVAPAAGTQSAPKTAYNTWRISAQNLLLQGGLFWDGRVDTLAGAGARATAPILSRWPIPASPLRSRSCAALCAGVRAVVLRTISLRSLCRRRCSLRRATRIGFLSLHQQIRLLAGGQGGSPPPRCAATCCSTTPTRRIHYRRVPGGSLARWYPAVFMDGCSRRWARHATPVLPATLIRCIPDLASAGRIVTICGPKPVLRHVHDPDFAQRHAARVFPQWGV